MTIRITCVCLGNICRSPIAQAVLAAELGDLDVEVDSVGTGGWHVGEGADPRAVQALTRAGYDLEHLARQADPRALASSDLILAMDAANLRDLRHMGVQADLLRSFDPHADDTEVPDPYYGSEDGFDEVVAMVRSAVPGIRARVQEFPESDDR